ncbi:hypothetical protein CPLU01_12480 [Colletotrichum plurivorum]|uniref:G domain-containing protein n=1 Tax=Colletotrichum plurivorum TaxID=2175906 RepID=A0A8H6N6L7_9PEZI|nr:hypothetical protein CPLU01_12480 [Colletotrichum plurivorum]
MGVVGSGKSSFIQLLVDDDVNVGHDLSTGTTHVKFYGFHDERHQRNVFLIDTPGLNDATRSDAAILKEIAFTLTSLYRKKIPLAGIVYLHDIRAKRMAGSNTRSLRMLKEMCGEPAYPHVILAANMGGSPDTAARDETILRDLVSRPDWWGDMKAGGCHVTSHVNDVQSAERILQLLVNGQNNDTAFAIQREMVDENRSLEDTGAGRELEREIHEARDKLRASIGELMSEEQHATEVGLKSALARQREEMQQGLQRADEAHQAIQISLDRLSDEQGLEMLKRLEREQQENEDILAELEKDRARAQARQIQRETELSEESRQLAEQLSASGRNSSLSDTEMRNVQEKLRAVQMRRDEEKAKGEETMEELRNKKEAAEKRRLRRKQVTSVIFRVLVGTATIVAAVVAMDPSIAMGV